MEGTFKREGIYVYLWLIHVKVWQKTKFCKAIILQLKFFFLFLKRALGNTQMKKKRNPPKMRKTWVQSLGWEDPPEKRRATYSSILAWRISWTGQSVGLPRIGHNWATFTFTFYIMEIVNQSQNLLTSCYLRSQACTHQLQQLTFERSLELHLRPHPRPTESETACYWQDSRWFMDTSEFENHYRKK